MKKSILCILYLYYIYIKKKKINNNNIVIVRQLAFKFLIFEQKNKKKIRKSTILN